MKTNNRLLFEIVNHNFQMNLLSDKIGSLSLDDPPPPPSKWQHWIYDCKDFPIHEHYINNNVKMEECQFCMKVNNMLSFKPQSTFESKKNFLHYIREGDKFCSVNSMRIFVEYTKKSILPSQMAESVFFNRKLGSAFFRDGIPPNKEHPSNALGGNFQLLLMGTKGNKEMLEKFDKIFNKIFKMTANKLEKGESFANAINGIFIRCEINPGKNIKNAKEAYNDLSNLPFMIKIEIWIGNNWNQPIVKKELIEKIEHEFYQMNLPKEVFRIFHYHIAEQERIRLWLYECQDWPIHKDKNNKIQKCMVHKCEYCFEVSKSFDGKEYRVESAKYWKDYIKEDQLIQNPNLMMEVIEDNKKKIMPSFLAKSISFNRKLGAAFFLNGIEPNYEHPLNTGAGCFCFLFYGTTGNEELLAKFDQIVHMLIVNITNSPNIYFINGIFVRCEINPNSSTAFNDTINLPFIFKFEVWIKKGAYVHNKIKLELIDKIVEKMPMRCFKHLFIPHKWETNPL